MMERGSRRWWDVLAALLLLLALWTSAFRLEVTAWTEHLNRVDLLVTLGLILGILLGLSVFERKTVFWMMAAYSLFFLPWQVAGAVSANLPWYVRITQMAQRIGASFAAFFRNQPNPDTILFFALMGVLYWLIGLAAGYSLTRHGRPWVPLAVAGIALFIIDYNHSFLAHRYRYSGVFVLFSLLLIGRMYYLRSRREWLDSGVTIDFETGYNLGRSMLIGGLILVLVAWNLPSLVEAFTPGTEANSKFSASWSGLKERISNAVTGLKNPVLYVSDSFSQTMSLGNGAVLGDEVLFTVKSSKPQNNARYYWRGFSYDTYDGTEWLNEVNTRITLSEDEWPVAYPLLVGRRKVDFIYTLKSGPVRVIYVPSMVLSLNLPARLVVEETGKETYDVVSALTDTPLHAGDSFQARAWVAQPTVNQLKATGREYPEWVTKRYLQLPDDLPERIRATAQEIAAGKETPYDQVMAITQYLREEISYQETIPDPPAGRNAIDWFLFDYKKGFCNYYASAEVLMLRSIGIPARIAVGYAEGLYDEAKGEFEVRQVDSHAWPEVYFSGVGWVEFEPTASQPATTLAEDNTAQNEEGAMPLNPLLETPGAAGAERDLRGEIEDVEVPEASAPVTEARWMWIPLLGAALAGLVFLWLRKHPDWLQRPFPLMLQESLERKGLETPRLLRFWARWSQLTSIERMFDRVSWMLWLLGKKVIDGETPLEQVAALVEYVPETQEPAGVLLDEYHRAEYSPHPFDLSLARKSHAEIWRLVLSSWAKRILAVSHG